MLVGPLLALLAVTSGCSLHADPGAPAPPRPGREIHGRAIPSASCHARAAQRLTVERSSLETLVLCPLSVEPGPAVRLSATAGLFEPIVTKLATPGSKYPSGTVCPAYADFPQKVLARAHNQWLVIDLPQDSCGHYDRDLLGLLAQARHAQQR